MLRRLVLIVAVASTLAAPAAPALAADVDPVCLIRPNWC